MFRPVQLHRLFRLMTALLPVISLASCLSTAPVPSTDSPTRASSQAVDAAGVPPWETTDTWACIPLPFDVASQFVSANGGVIAEQLRRLKNVERVVQLDRERATARLQHFTRGEWVGFGSVSVVNVDARNLGYAQVRVSIGLRLEALENPASALHITLNCVRRTRPVQSTDERFAEALESCFPVRLMLTYSDYNLLTFESRLQQERQAGRVAGRLVRTADGVLLVTSPSFGARVATICLF